MAFGQPKIEYKSNAQILKMREAGLVLAEALDEAVAAAQPGVTTKEVDAVFAGVLERHGATSNFLATTGSRPPSAPRSTMRWSTASPANTCSRTGMC